MGIKKLQEWQTFSVFITNELKVSAEASTRRHTRVANWLIDELTSPSICRDDREKKETFLIIFKHCVSGVFFCQARFEQSVGGRRKLFLLLLDLLPVLSQARRERERNENDFSEMFSYWRLRVISSFILPSGRKRSGWFDFVPSALLHDRQKTKIPNACDLSQGSDDALLSLFVSVSVSFNFFLITESECRRFTLSLSRAKSKVSQ